MSNRKRKIDTNDSKDNKDISKYKRLFLRFQKRTRDYNQVLKDLHKVKVEKSSLLMQFNLISKYWFMLDNDLKNILSNNDADVSINHSNYLYTLLDLAEDDIINIDPINDLEKISIDLDEKLQEKCQNTILLLKNILKNDLNKNDNDEISIEEKNKLLELKVKNLNEEIILLKEKNQQLDNKLYNTEKSLQLSLKQVDSIKFEQKSLHKKQKLENNTIDHNKMEIDHITTTTTTSINNNNDNINIEKEFNELKLKYKNLMEEKKSDIQANYRQQQLDSIINGTNTFYKIKNDLKTTISNELDNTNPQNKLYEERINELEKKLKQQYDEYQQQIIQIKDIHNQSINQLNNNINNLTQELKELEVIQIELNQLKEEEKNGK